MSDDKESKTEPASDKKVGEAITQGNIPFSREAPVFASILGLLIFLVYVARDQGAPLVRGSLSGRDSARGRDSLPR